MASARKRPPEDETEELIDEDLTANPDAWRVWPGRVTAVNILGVGKRRFRELLEGGRVSEFDAPDGSKRYPPSALKRLSDEVYFDTAPADDAQHSTIGGVAMDSARVNVDLLKQNQGHLERVIDMMLKGYDKAMGSLTSALEYEQRANGELRRENQAARNASKRDELQLLEAQTQSAVTLEQEARRTLITENVAPKLGPLVGAVTDSVSDMVQRMRPGAVSVAPPRVTAEPSATPRPSYARQEGDAAWELVQSIGVENLGVLKSMGTPEQAELIDAVVAKMTEPVAPKEENTP